MLTRRSFLRALGIGAAAILGPELEPRRKLWQVPRSAPFERVRALDSISERPIFATSSNRRLLSTYGGPLARIRRSADGQVIDIYSEAEARAFLCGQNSQVLRIYDQSGNGRDAVFANARA